jgi:spore coat polysaccharide biosynthesis protein SpsF
MFLKDIKSATALVAARMGSSRFQGKTLSDLNGLPMIKQQIERIKMSRYIDNVVVATTDLPADHKIEEWCYNNKIGCYRGSASDVLGRLNCAAQHFNMNTIVEVLGDNPLVHSDLIDSAVELYFEKKVDYVATLTNEYPRADKGLKKFPIGVRVQVFPISTLIRCAELATDESHREHATSYIADNPHIFSTAFVEAVGKFSRCNRPELTFAVNIPKNLDLIRCIFSELFQKDNNFTLQQVIDFFDSKEELKLLMGNY